MLLNIVAVVDTWQQQHKLLVITILICFFFLLQINYRIFALDVISLLLVEPEQPLSNGK